MGTLTRYRDRLRALRADEAGMTPAQMIVTLIGMAIIAGVGTVAIMTLIPWFQDGAAERETDSVAVAQESYYGMYGANYQDRPRYASQSQLVSAGLLDDSWEKDGNSVVNRVGVGVDSGWEVFIRSGSDAVIYTNSEQSGPCELEDVGGEVIQTYAEDDGEDGSHESAFTSGLSCAGPLTIGGSED